MILVMGVLPFSRDAVGVFYHPSKVGLLLEKKETFIYSEFWINSILLSGLESYFAHVLCIVFIMFVWIRTVAVKPASLRNVGRTC